MNIRNLISRLNWRHILFYCAAFWFFVYGFKTLSFIHHLKLVEAVRSLNGEISNDVLTGKELSGEELVNSVLWTNFASVAGLISGFGMALFLSIKRKLFWVNPFIAFLVVFFAHKYGWLAWDYAREFFWYPGQLFNNLLLEFLTNGIILLIFGFIIVYLTGKNRHSPQHQFAEA